ncbi:hypothetical protein AA313_de0201740 [Arthrobotrys entomopaga]|nr:hypothetical protein AA313_de0201740 [Arthrobotrys entomopaga]
MGPESTPKACATCNIITEDLKLCAKCKKTHYCSKVCQIADWKTHKESCGKTYAQGVIIHCFGDRQVLRTPDFEVVGVDTTHDIFWNPSVHDTSDIADRIGIPIFTTKLPLEPAWRDTKPGGQFMFSHPYDNQDATFLHICCDPDAKPDPTTGVLGWAWCGMRWQRYVGSALVVRQDKKPLTALQVEVLAHYCRFECQPLFGSSIGEDYPGAPMSKAEVLSRISKESFLAHWHRLLGERRIPNAQNIATPYDV